jgi:hypothetical protein
VVLDRAATGVVPRPVRRHPPRGDRARIEGLHEEMQTVVRILLTGMSGSCTSTPAAAQIRRSAVDLVSVRAGSFTDG